MAAQRYLLVLYVVGLAHAQYYGDYARVCPIGTDTIVNLFEWKWGDVRNECRALARNGFCGVQVSPPNEHEVLRDPVSNVNYPWYQRFHPVSYQLTSRSGISNEFEDMVVTCNNDGVRVFVDAVINHMAGPGFGYGTASSFWNGDCERYDGPPFQGDILGVDDDFHGISECPSPNLDIIDWQDPLQIRRCRREGLRDLRLSKQSVQNTIATYMNNMISIGVGGFFLDSAMHMEPDEIQSILNRLDPLNSDYFPLNTSPYIYLQLPDLGQGPIYATNYTQIARVSEYKFGRDLGDIIRGNNGRRLSELETFTQGMMNQQDAVAFVDNHETQRGIGPDNSFTHYVSFWERRSYEMANAFMLAYGYAMPRIMSSYYWPRDIQGNVDVNWWYGPPSDANGNTEDVDCLQQDKWICEHRWESIGNMVKFHNAALGTPVENWYSNGNQIPNTNNLIAFSRGNNAFFVMNNENFGFSRIFTTGLPDGTYCDVVNCENNLPPCGICDDTSRQLVITVSSGTADINIPNDNQPFMAFHITPSK